jgi:hypothetical protein
MESLGIIKFEDPFLGPLGGETWSQLSML